MRAVPEDLVTEILLKLPVKSLLRFRCVCKSWNHLIQSSDFIKNHLKHNSTKNDYILITKFLVPLHPYDSFSPISPDLQTPILSLLSYDSLSAISPDLKIPHDGNVSQIEICGPCNGLICISVNRQDIILCNPFLREFRSLQCRAFQPDPLRWFDVGIGFEYDSSTEDYKIVRIVTERPLDTIYFVEVYEHRNQSWREINNHMFEEQNPLQLSSTTNWNEIIHWVNLNREILSFDIKTEVFRFLMLPSDPLKEGKKMHLTVLHEFLSVFAYTSSYDHQTDQYIDLWKMGDYGVEGSWTKLFTIRPLVGIERSLLLWKDKAIILEGFELPLDNDSPPGKLFTYSVANLKLEDLQIDGQLGSFRGMICNESLISVN